MPHVGDTGRPSILPMPPPWRPEPSLNADKAKQGLMSTYAEISATRHTPSGSWISKSEMETAIQIIDGKPGEKLSSDKMNALAEAFLGKRLTNGAQELFNKALGLVPEDPTLPPIVALYSVAINDAAASGSVARMMAVSNFAHKILDPMGGAGTGVRSDMVAFSAAERALRSTPGETENVAGLRNLLKNLDNQIKNR